MSAQPALSKDSASTATGESRAALQAAVVERASVGRQAADAMYRLYAGNYADTDRAMFARDLAAKTHVLLLSDESGALCGFSTLQLYTSTVSDRSVRVIYSGDTIIDPCHWGSSALAFEWLRFAGEVQREMPATPLYWLLIVKGHRTYRFLSTFARHYIPHHKLTATGDQERLRRVLAREKFGDAFDPSTGIVRFESPRGRLIEDLADVPARHRRLPPVAYFLERNPGYRQGDELVCLCRLAVQNLRPLAARVFAPQNACLQDG